MLVLLGVLIVLAAGALQGAFYLPMTYTRKWEWEHSWIMFAISGMLIFSWIIVSILVPGVMDVYRTVPARDVVVMILFGAIWGVGALLNGVAISRLGMALAFPIVLGIVASFGALVPMAVFFPSNLLAPKGITVILGTIIAIIGIVICSKAESIKHPESSPAAAEKKGSFAVNLFIAIMAGLMSALMNIGFSYSGSFVEAAKQLGVSDKFAANAVWGLILTSGGIVNIIYCLFLMAKKGTFGMFFGPETLRNMGLGTLMGLVWTVGLYLYGIGAIFMGGWGVVVGWVLFMSTIIIMGNILGLWRGEWTGASPKARALLNRGLTILIVAIIIVAVSNKL